MEQIELQAKITLGCRIISILDLNGVYDYKHGRPPMEIASTYSFCKSVSVMGLCSE
jgi:hypothetical protein